MKDIFLHYIFILLFFIFCFNVVSATQWGYNSNQATTGTGGGNVTIYQNNTYITIGGSNSTFNATYDTWFPNWTLFNKFWYNFSTWDKAYADNINLTLSNRIDAISTAGNASWNESYANTLYNPINWSYNSTYDKFAYNQTGNYNYNQTTPANDYTNSVNNSLASWLATVYLTIANFNTGSNNLQTNISAVNTSVLNGMNTMSNNLQTNITGVNASSYAYTQTVNNSLASWITNNFLSLANWITGSGNLQSNISAVNTSLLAGMNTLSNNLQTNVSAVNVSLIAYADSLLITQYYNASTINVLTGTPQGVIENLRSYDEISYNVSEVSSDILFMVNFTNVTTLNQIIIRYLSVVGETHSIDVELYDFITQNWEGYNRLGNTNGLYNVKAFGVFDSQNHVNSGNVSLRITTTNIGTGTDKWQFDWIAISKGVATPSSVETDPYSIHKDGTIPLTGNWVNDFNITAQELFANNICYSNGTNAYTLNNSYANTTQNWEGNYSLSSKFWTNHTATSEAYTNAVNNSLASWIATIYATILNVNTASNNLQTNITAVNASLLNYINTEVGTNNLHMHDATNITNSLWVNKTGDTMTGNLNMSINNLTGVTSVLASNLSFPCDLTLSGNMCHNSSGWYIVG